MHQGNTCTLSRQVGSKPGLLKVFEGGGTLVSYDCHVSHLGATAISWSHCGPISCCTGHRQSIDQWCCLGGGVNPPETAWSARLEDSIMQIRRALHQKVIMPMLLSSLWMHDTPTLPLPGFSSTPCLMHVPDRVEKKGGGNSH